MSRLTDLSSNPTLRNFAVDASQSAIRPVANFLAPRVEVPDVSGKYKVYDAKHRYKRPNTRRRLGERATLIGFEASDASYNLEAHALDFPVPVTEGISPETAMQHAQYGTTLLADAAGLDHEAEVIELAIATVGAGTDSNFASTSVDPIAVLNTQIVNVIKAAKNGASIKVLFGATGFLNLISNEKVKGRFVGGSGGAKKGGTSVVIPSMEDISNMLFGNPQCELSMMVEDSAAEGITESIDFLMSTAILIFASNDQPNTMDPSFMKTFVPMGGFMVPGTYRSQDERDEFLKMDWTTEPKVTNSEAVVRVNGNNS